MFVFGGIYGPPAPCKEDCKDRNAECHCYCERYLAYEKEREAFRKEKETKRLGLVDSKAMKKAMDLKAKRKQIGLKHI